MARQKLFAEDRKALGTRVILSEHQRLKVLAAEHGISVIDLTLEGIDLWLTAKGEPVLDRGMKEEGE